MREVLAVLVVAVVACTPAAPELVRAPPPPPPRAEAPLEAAPEPVPDHAVVDATLRPEERVLDVALTVPLAWLPRDADRVVVRFRNERFRAGPTSYSEFVRGIDAARNEVPWQEEHTLPPDRVLSLRYRVHLEHAAADPVVGVDEVPHATAGGWFLNGRAFVPRLYLPTPARDKNLDLEAEIALHLPEGYALESSAGAESEGRIRTQSLAELHDAIYYTGKFQSKRLTEGSVDVTLVTSDFTAEDLAPLGSLVTRTLRLGAKELGTIPPVHLLLAYDKAAERAGGVVGRGISLLYEAPPDGRASSPMGVVVVHELMHLWNRADQEWMSEGFTRYLEVMMSLRLDAAEKEEIAERLLSVHDNYARAIGNGTIAQARDSLAYSGGAVIAFCTDADLKADGSSLALVHQAVRKKTGVPLVVDELLNAVDAASKQSGVALRERLTRRGAIDFGKCLRQAGYRVKVTEYAGITAKALALDVLHIRGHDTSTAKVLRVEEGSPFQQGDVIESVEGTPIHSMEGVPYLLRRHRPGQIIHMLVRRGNATVRITLAMPKLAQTARPKQRRFVVVSYP